MNMYSNQMGEISIRKERTTSSANIDDGFVGCESLNEGYGHGRDDVIGHDRIDIFARDHVHLGVPIFQCKGKRHQLPPLMLRHLLNIQILLRIHMICYIYNLCYIYFIMRYCTIHLLHTYKYLRKMGLIWSKVIYNRLKC